MKLKKVEQFNAKGTEIKGIGEGKFLEINE
jgi:hypothetical protein